ncbi:MAG: cytochrome C oxidase subunit IV family protein [Actinomycetota bacterium]|nr:cytochrome C oxidase subunit IV family protein [Actinomycetota bacterium]
MASSELHAPREEEALHEHPSPRKYVWIAIILAIVTAAEVAIYYIPALESLLVPFLIAFALIKFIMVALYFMHLKFDSKLFRRFFVTGVVLALVVFTVVLLTFFLRPETAGVTG